jgi:hypothetical protein
MILKLVEDQVHFNRVTVGLILLEDVRGRKICMKFVQHSLTDEQNEHKIKILRLHPDLLGLLTCIVAGDTS